MIDWNDTPSGGKTAVGHFDDQWNFNQHYYVTQDGHAITEPMTAADIVAQFGPIRELEAQGFRVIPC